MSVEKMSDEKAEKLFGSGLVIFGGKRSPQKIHKKEMISPGTLKPGPTPDIAWLAIDLHERKEKEQQELETIVNSFSKEIKAQTNLENLNNQLDPLIKGWLEKTSWSKSHGDAKGGMYPSYINGRLYKAIFQFTKRYCLNIKELPQGNLTINEFIEAPDSTKYPFTAAQIQLDVSFPVIEKGNLSLEKDFCCEIIKTDNYEEYFSIKRIDSLPQMCQISIDSRLLNSKNSNELRSKFSSIVDKSVLMDITCLIQEFLI